METRVNKHSPKNLKARERAIAALELRRTGMTFEDIAAQLGYSSRSGAYNAVNRYLQRIEYEGVDELRKIEGERLDRAMLAIWPQVLNGDLGATNALVRIQERRAKLFGLDAPQKIAPTTPDGNAQYEGVVVYIPENGRGEPDEDDH